MMGSFLRPDSGLVQQPVEPLLEVYELDCREPCLRIDAMGYVWMSSFWAKAPYTPKVLFADVPVMIHTSYGFSLAPLSQASDKTGPE